MTNADRSTRCLVIVPAYNEVRSVGVVVSDLLQHLENVDVLVIDDGSTDETDRAVPEPARTIRLPMNLGIGGAMQTGYRFAEKKGYGYAIQVDADGQHPAAHVQPLINAIRSSGSDMVIGSRFLEDRGYDQTKGRMAGIHWLNTLMRLLSGQRFTDCTSGFRVVNRRVIEAFAQWYPEDYPEPEVALMLVRKGYRVEEVPVNMKQRQAGQSSISFARGLFYVLKVSLALLLTMIRRPWTTIEPMRKGADH